MNRAVWAQDRDVDVGLRGERSSSRACCLLCAYLGSCSGSEEPAAWLLGVAKYVDRELGDAVELSLAYHPD